MRGTMKLAFLGVCVCAGAASWARGRRDEAVDAARAATDRGPAASASEIPAPANLLAKAGWTPTPELSGVFEAGRIFEYTSLAFTARHKAINVPTSMDAVGDGYDNAIAESFFTTLECELLDFVGTFSTHNDAREQVFSFPEGFYNNHRLHSRLGKRSPAEFERNAERFTTHAQLP
jgi:transposase InsO family protein